MKIEQNRWFSGGPNDVPTSKMGGEAQLVLAFGGPEPLRNGAWMAAAKNAYPNAHIIGCSTAGEILGTHVSDDSLVTTAIHFDRATIRTREIDIEDCKNSYDAGEQLARGLDVRGLRHVIVVSDGQKVNGSDLARGLQENLPKGVSVTGGLAGDGDRFAHTFVFADHEPEEGRVVALGLYGADLRVGYGSLGGWDAFGPQRIITRSEGNVLYELDGQPALALYKKYLGEHAAGLPATGLLFPLSLRVPGNDHDVVRTILNVNEADQSLTFAGDLPEGSLARLMKANFDRLVDGAHGAAASSLASIHDHPQLAILISCVGRKLVLKQRTEQELEAVRDVLGPDTALTGFYSYGEICPASPKANCELHNQTMTITTLAET